MKMTNELFVESRPIKLRVEMALRGQKNAMRGMGTEKKEHVQSPAKVRKWTSKT